MLQLAARLGLGDVSLDELIRLGSLTEQTQTAQAQTSADANASQQQQHTQWMVDLEAVVPDVLTDAAAISAVQTQAAQLAAASEDSHVPISMSGRTLSPTEAAELREHVRAARQAAWVPLKVCFCLLCVILIAVIAGVFVVGPFVDAVVALFGRAIGAVACCLPERSQNCVSACACGLASFARALRPAC